MWQGRNGDRQWSREREVQEAKVTPVTTSHHFLGSGFVRAGQENPQSPFTHCSFQGARIENNQYPHLLSDI